MARVKYGAWLSFGFWSGTVIGIIFAFLSLLIGTFLIFIDPVLGLLGLIGFFGFLLIATFAGLISAVTFVIGRALMSITGPVRSDFWRVVTVHVLGFIPFWFFASFLNIFITPSPTLVTFLLPFISLGVSVLVILLWSTIFIWIWTNPLRRRIPI